MDSFKQLDDYFTFEDGTPGRFWGVNINGSANFPEHSYSEIFAKRLMKVGINLVRFHQLDAEWATPNTFSVYKGMQKKVILAALTNKAWSGLTIWPTA